MATITIRANGSEKHETVRGLVQSALQRERENLNFALARTEGELARFEKRYRVPSAKFYRRYRAGKFDDRDDFIDWAGEYQIYLLLKKQISSLRGLKIAGR
ncbi:hypothetical protein HUU40_21120 [candidate division KSB1 bacterium]|nr:hypothetical protein [candidate division KSB1 bacterium]